MKFKIGVGITVVAMILAMNSCENKSVPLPSGVPTNCDTSNLTYNSTPAATMQTIINANCAIGGCHVPGGTAPTDYTSYASLRPYARGGQSSQFWNYLFINKTMPLAPQPPLDACTQAKFKEWLIVGAPQ